MSENLYDLICLSGEDEFLMEHSFRLTLKTNNSSHAYYIPYLTMKQMNNNLYKQREAEFYIGNADASVVIKDCCEKLYGGVHIIISNVDKIATYMLCSFLTGKEYEIDAPAFRKKEDYDTYIEFLSSECGKELKNKLLRKFYDNNKKLIISIMGSGSKIYTEIINDMWLNINVSEKYDIEILSMFKNISFLYLHSRGDWDHFYYAFTKICKNENGWILYKPIRYPEHKGWKEWDTDQKTVEQILIEEKYKKISFNCSGEHTLYL